MRESAVQLRDAILAHKPDRGGSRGAKGYDYQRDWAFCCLLELHDASERFLVFFDYHDDVVVLNSAENPDRATFYQIKSRDDRPWSLRDLIDGGPRKAKGRRGTPRVAGSGQMALPIVLTPVTAGGCSIVGKLCAHIGEFEGCEIYLCLVSNQRLNVPLQSGKNATEFNDVAFSQLCKKDKERLRKTLRKELGLPTLPDLDTILRFKWTPLSSGGHETHAIGELERFISRKFPDRKASATDIYHRIMEEIRQRNNFRWDVSTFDDARRKKGLTDQQFAHMLIGSVFRKNAVERWESIRYFLVQEQMIVGRVMSIESAWNRYATLRTDPRDPAIERLREEATQFVAPYVREPDQLETLRTFLEKGLVAVRSRFSGADTVEAQAGGTLTRLSDTDIQAALLYELIDGQQASELQKAYPQLEEKAT